MAGTTPCGGWHHTVWWLAPHRVAAGTTPCGGWPHTVGWLAPHRGAAGRGPLPPPGVCVFAPLASLAPNAGDERVPTSGIRQSTRSMVRSIMLWSCAPEKQG